MLAFWLTLAWRTPLTVPTSSSFCFPTTSLSTSSMKTPRRKIVYASCATLGNISMMISS